MLLNDDRLARFYAKVDQSGGPDACHPWTGALLPGGYGSYDGRTLGTSQVGAHVMAWLLANDTDAMPDDCEIDHTCHNADLACAGGPTCLHRRCCNPAHLDAVPHAENNARRIARAQTCPSGHPWADGDYYTDATGRRHCRPCNRAAQQRRYARRRAEQGRHATKSR